MALLTLKLFNFRCLHLKPVALQKRGVGYRVWGVGKVENHTRAGSGAHQEKKDVFRDAQRKKYGVIVSIPRQEAWVPTPHTLHPTPFEVLKCVLVPKATGVQGW
jgi:hypothetical protein